MFRIITLNVNGIRAAARKGFFDWLPSQAADVICLQETRAQPEQRSADVFFPEGYNAYHCDAERKGYSGVAIYSRHEPDRVETGIGCQILTLRDVGGEVILGAAASFPSICPPEPAGKSGRYSSTTSWSD